MQTAPLPNPILALPLTTASTPLLKRPVQRRGEREGFLILPPLLRSGDDIHLVNPPSSPIFSTGVTLLPLLATAASLSASLLVVSTPLFSLSASC